LFEIYSSDEDFEVDKLSYSESEESASSADDDIDLEDIDVKPTVTQHVVKKNKVQKTEPE
jgi:hypothetical protein